MRTVHLIITWLLLASAVPALAAETHPCTRVEEDVARLACYDRTFGTPAAPKPLPAPAPATAPATAPAPARRVDTPPERFEAVVSRIEWRNGVFTATLDNGQVWVQTERDSRVRFEPSETVTVRPGSLGSFFMSGKQGLAARVRLRR